MNGVHKRPKVLWINVRCNAVTQIEHMPRSIAIALENSRDPRTDDFRAFSQRRWIKISL